jgi:hypothetical protein
MYVGTQLTADIERMLDTDVHDLYAELARPLKGAGPRDLARRGAEIYQNLKAELRQIVCGSKTVVAFYDSKNASPDSVALIGAVADCISGYVTGISPVVVSVLLVREGLHLYCKDHWASAGP